jgi:hypothetical protein
MKFRMSAALRREFLVLLVVFVLGTFEAAWFLTYLDKSAPIVAANSMLWSALLLAVLLYKPLLDAIHWLAHEELAYQQRQAYFAQLYELNQRFGGNVPRDCWPQQPIALQSGELALTSTKELARRLLTANHI